MEYTEQDYWGMTGFDPVQDDLERLNCNKAGEVAHNSCGYCLKHHKPRHVCGCLLMDGVHHRIMPATFPI